MVVLGLVDLSTPTTVNFTAIMEFSAGAVGTRAPDKEAALSAPHLREAQDFRKHFTL